MGQTPAASTVDSVCKESSNVSILPLHIIKRATYKISEEVLNKDGVDVVYEAVVCSLVPDPRAYHDGGAS